jgi:NAD(P)-dependent dehydrogenase (short-subunit alcohol dehydrogenase family)
MILLPRLAKLYPELLGKFKDGVWVGLFAPTEGQAETLFGRAVTRLTSERALEILNDVDDAMKKPFSELTFQNWLDIYSTNVFGAAMLTSALLPLLKRPDAKEKSHVVNIASMGGVQGSTKFAGLSAYSSSKGALCNFTECLAEELKNDGVAVNALAIGSVATEMFTAAFPGFKAATTPEKMAEFIAEFTLTGQNFFNGKILPVSNSTP